MKQLLITIAALVLVGCGEPDHQHSHAETEKQDLTGKWLGKGYRCGPNEADQEISITQNGNKVVAIKITDPPSPPSPPSGPPNSIYFSLLKLEDPDPPSPA